MFARILRHEWRALRADSTLWVIALVFAAGIGFGVWNGVRWMAFQRDAIAAARGEEAERYARLQTQIDGLVRGAAKTSPFADPRSPGNLGGRLGPRYAVLPPGPLAATAIGQSDLLPAYFRVSTDARENIVSGTEIENPHRLLAGRFDLAFVLIYIYPLLILAVTYNMLSAEKEEGTLALALSQPVSLAALVTGKVTLRAAVLGGLVIACACLAVAVSGTDLARGGAGTRLLLWACAVAAYGAFWFSLAVFVASRGRGSATNATLLACLWLLFVVLLPSSLNMTITTMFPVPSRVELVQATRVASDEANEAGSALLARYYEDHPDLAGGDVAQAVSDANVVRLAVADEVERRVRPVVRRYEDQLARQQDSVTWLRFLSPAMLMQDALNDLAGAGTARHRHFLAQVDAFHDRWRRHFTPLIVRKAQITDLSALPLFAYDEEPLSAVAGRVALTLAGLAFPAALLGAAGLRRLRRFPVVG